MKRDTITDDYIPCVYKDGNFKFPGRSFSILHIKLGGLSHSRNTTKSNRIKDRRVQHLCSLYGLSKRDSLTFLNRKEPQILRVEELINGIFDSILLCNIQIFSDNRKIFVSLVRKIIKVSTYNMGLVCSYWKDFSNYMYNRLADFDEKLPKLNRHNMFWTHLSRIDHIIRLFNPSLDKTDYEAYAHLSSTRQMPAGDSRIERKSIDDFKTSIEEPFVPDEHILYESFYAAFHIGRQIISKNKKVSTKPHISLNSAGSYHKTVAQGGRGREIRDALDKYVTVIPEEDETIETPFGDLVTPKGEPRWRHWCRPKPYIQYPEVSFGELIPEEYFQVGDTKVNLFYQGFDESIGSQIFIVSYLEYMIVFEGRLNIPCRILTIPEPGYKARIVTTGPYYLNVLQQGLSHRLKDFLKTHPSCQSSLHKTDQAWQALYMMTGKRYRNNMSCLSSDLKEATDHIPKSVITALLRGFCKGIKINPRSLDIIIRLINNNRTFVHKRFGDISISQSRGSMMGEPITKIVLTLLNLVAENIAFLRYHSYKDVYASWRSFHIGGDDHIAIGPIRYLRLITQTHLRLGSKISVGKHGISNTMVKYCEKVIVVKYLFEKPFNVHAINSSTELYNESPFVDSVKIRLLSPVTKALEVYSERNIAIGKGLSLGRSLQWLNRDHFPQKWIMMVRARFFSRMGSLLPGRESLLYWHLHMPQKWGGLSLMMKGEERYIFDRLPLLTKTIMHRYSCSEIGIDEAQQALSRFLSNNSYRGYVLHPSDSNAIKQHIEQVIMNLPMLTWKEVQAEFNPKGDKSIVELIESAHTGGYMSTDDVMQYMLRPVLFRDILTGQGIHKPYNTLPLKRRYAYLWDQYIGEEGVSFDTFMDLLYRKEGKPFFKVEYPEAFHFYSDRGYLFKSAIDDALNGMPDLSIDIRYS